LKSSKLISFSIINGTINTSRKSFPQMVKHWTVCSRNLFTIHSLNLLLRYLVEQGSWNFYARYTRHSNALCVACETTACHHVIYICLEKARDTIYKYTPPLTQVKLIFSTPLVD
jgi:hypothetical protein